MSERHVKTYELYLDARSAIADARREELRHENLAENSVFGNPQRTRRGMGGGEIAEPARRIQIPGA